MNKDIGDVVDAASPGGRYTLATVVGIVGSSYRRPGARMLIDEHGRRTGSVSGGCLERSLVKRGRWLAREGPRLLRVSTEADPDETELAYLGCGGALDILVENVDVGDASSGDPIALLRWIRERRSPAVLATVLEGSRGLVVGRRFALTSSEHRVGTDGARLWSVAHRHAQDVLTSGRSARRAIEGPDGTSEVFFEFVPPVRELLVCGRHHDVHPVVTMARMMGWRVTVAAGRTTAAELGEPDVLIPPTPEAVARWARPRPDAAIVLMTHSIALDRQLLGALLGVPPPTYLGLLGPRHRTRGILEQLDDEGTCPLAESSGRVRGPIGLDLGGDGPAAIALSIVSDIQATWAERGARPLHHSEPRAASGLARESRTSSWAGTEWKERRR